MLQWEAIRPIIGRRRSPMSAGHAQTKGKGHRISGGGEKLTVVVWLAVFVGGPFMSAQSFLPSLCLS